MVAPNIVDVTTITGKSDGLAVTTSPTAITTCSTSTVFKINSVIVSNIDGINNADVTVTLYKAGITTSFTLAKTIVVPADAVLIAVSKEMGIYLEEGDEIRIAASADGDLEAICSYEIISAS
jgi:hypothetical protein